MLGLKVKISKTQYLDVLKKKKHLLITGTEVSALKEMPR